MQKMRRAGRLAHEALDLAETLIEVGRTTEEMDKELHTFICSLDIMDMEDYCLNLLGLFFGIGWNWIICAMVYNGIMFH